MVTLRKSTRTLVPHTTLQPAEKPIRIIRNNRWAYVLPSELTDDERRVIFVAAFQIYE